MKPAGREFPWSRWLLVLFAITYGVVMLALDTRPMTDWYSPTPYHRYQAMAFLHGHLYLSDSVEALQPGLAWHDGHVEQVWGLGIGLWLLPFEAVWRLFGGTACPERIALGCAFALLALYAGSTALRMVREGRHSLGLALVWLVLPCPPLWTLARDSQLVFEETVLYAIIVSLAILVSIVRVAVFQSRTDYLVCCALSAFAGWVRPTHAIYGLCAVVVCSWIFWLRRRSWRGAAMGAIFWALSAGLLAYTNYARFGSATEFGHRLTIAPDNMVYLTRFGNPFRQASVPQAAKELFGLLFLAQPRGENAFADGLFPGQADVIRWRRLDLTTFDPIYALIALAAVEMGVAKFIRNRKVAGSHQPESILIVAVMFWSGISLAGLACFYLYYPAIASRYLFDFAPAFVGFVLALWTCVPAKRTALLWPLLATWLMYEIMAAKMPVNQMSFPDQLPVEIGLPHVAGTHLRAFNGRYDLAHHPTETGIAHNGHGWEQDSGVAADVLSLVVDEPQFIELRVSARREVNGEPARKDAYHAQIDGVNLPLRTIQNDENGFKVIFEVPASILARRGNEMLFLCFSDGYDAEARDSERFLYSVRWRK